MSRRTDNARTEIRQPQDHLPKAIPAEVSLGMSMASHISWANTEDRTARTAKARATFQAKFLAAANGDPIRAESLRKAYYAGLALKSAKTRRLNREAREAGAA